MYSQSRSWVSPQVRKDKQRKSANAARQKFCPKSFAWEHNLDLEKHRKEVEAERQRQFQKRATQHVLETAERQRLGLPPKSSTVINDAFGGKKFESNRSAVLHEPTVFVPSFGGEDPSMRTDTTFTGYEWVKEEKELADWPSQAEARYEGDERIATDKLHSRFLGAPRVVGNSTVNWMQKSFIPQYPLEDFYKPREKLHEVQIFLRTHVVPELEIDDSEGERCIGTSMMDMLDD